MFVTNTHNYITKTAESDCINTLEDLANVDLNKHFIVYIGKDSFNNSVFEIIEKSFINYIISFLNPFKRIGKEFVYQKIAETDMGIFNKKIESGIKKIYKKFFKLDMNVQVERAQSRLSKRFELFNNLLANANKFDAQDQTSEPELPLEDKLQKADECTQKLETEPEQSCKNKETCLEPKVYKRKLKLANFPAEHLNKSEASLHRDKDLSDDMKATLDKIKIF